MTDFSTNLVTVEDEEFLASYDASAFAHPSLAVDVVITTVHESSIKVLLHQRAGAPQRGRAALPGGFVALDESLEEAAARILKDKVGLEDVYLEQLYTFGNVSRDPRTRVVTVTYLALVPPTRLISLPDSVFLGDVSVAFAREEGGPATVTLHDDHLDLAFDHADIIGLAVQRLRGKLAYAPVGYELLDPEFTLRDLQAIHETILAHPVNKDSFRRTILARDAVEPTGTYEVGVAWRPAELYRFTAAPEDS
jgi:8-oxo-dGTP diphosphatase